VLRVQLQTLLMHAPGIFRPSTTVRIQSVPKDSSLSGLRRLIIFHCNADGNGKKMVSRNILRYTISTSIQEYCCHMHGLSPVLSRLGSAGSGQSTSQDAVAQRFPDGLMTFSSSKVAHI